MIFIISFEMFLKNHKMKRILLIAVIGTVFCFTACKKNYACKCTYQGGLKNGETTTGSAFKAYESDAETDCYNEGVNIYNDDTKKYNNGSINEFDDVTCTPVRK
jgi:hypothetical protein